MSASQSAQRCHGRATRPMALETAYEGSGALAHAGVGGADGVHGSGGVHRGGVWVCVGEDAVMLCSRLRS